MLLSPLPQVAAVASQLNSLWSSTRVLCSGPKAYPVNAQRSHMQDITSKKTSKTASKAVELDEIENSEKLLSCCEEYLTILSETRNSHQRIKSVWKPSYVSSSTFFQNKTGFPESSLYSRSPQSGHNLLHFLGQTRVQQFLRKTLFNSSFMQSRGFYVERKTKTVEPTETDSVQKKVELGKITTTKKTSSKVAEDKLKTEEDKFKDGFKEGVEEGKKMATVPRWSRHPLSFLALLLNLFLLALLLRNLGGFSLPMDIKEVHMSNTMFSDVQGAYEAKNELQEVVEFLKNPHKFTSLGAKLPKGILLVGPPGNGKTLLARAVAGEAGVPFVYASGSEFDEIFVGTGAKKVRNMFNYAKRIAPCVVFIDEFDTLGSKRTNSSVAPYANQTVNQLLSEMDGFESNTGVIVLGATNKRENLDPAVVRAGRFDVEVRIDPPDLKARRQMLEHYLSQVVHSPGIDLDLLSKVTTGFSGADIKNAVNQAALRASLDNDSMVELRHLEFALDKIKMGPASKHRIPDASENKLVAYHESGHALVMLFTKDASPIYKITILPRGKTGGHTSFISEKDENFNKKSQLLALIDVCMGGYVAEQLIFGADSVSTGPSGDLQRATTIAKNMVERFGMSDVIGLRTVNYGDASVSSELRNQVDKEVKKILEESHIRVKSLIKSHEQDLKRLAEALLEHETLDAEAVKAIVLEKATLPKNYSDSILTKNEKMNKKSHPMRLK